MELMTKLAAKVDNLDCALWTQQQCVPVTPPRHGAGLGKSVYRQAPQQGGSLGMHRMQMHEFGASNFCHGCADAW